MHGSTDYSAIQAKFHTLDYLRSTQCGNTAMIYTLLLLFQQIHQMPPATRFIEGRDSAITYPLCGKDLPYCGYDDVHSCTKSAFIDVYDYLDLSKYGAESHAGLPEHVFYLPATYLMIKSMKTADDYAHAFKDYAYHFGSVFHINRDNSTYSESYVYMRGCSSLSFDKNAHMKHIPLQPIFDFDVDRFSRIAPVTDVFGGDISVVYPQNSYYNVKVGNGELRGNRTFVIREERWAEFIHNIASTLSESQVLLQNSS